MWFVQQEGALCGRNYIHILDVDEIVGYDVGDISIATTSGTFYPLIIFHHKMLLTTSFVMFSLRLLCVFSLG